MNQNDGGSETHVLYAWIATDPQGIEGIITAPLPGLGVVPLVCTGMPNAANLRPIAQVAADMRGSTARLVTFHRAKVLEELPPT